MINTEIRLAILAHYYEALYSEQGMGNEIKQLKNLSDAEISVNKIYLIDKKLIEGDLEYIDSGRPMVFVSRITAHGMDIVEKIMNESLDEFNPNDRSEMQKEFQTNNRFDKFYKKSIQVGTMIEIVVKVANQILPALGQT